MSQRQMYRLSGILVTAVIVLTVRSANAQSFFGGGVVAYDPEISTVSSGVVLDVQPTVSQDLKYVTITTQVQNSSLLALHNFQVASPIRSGPAQGFVGGVSFGVSPLPAGRDGSAAISTSPDEIERRAIAARSVLNRRGMFLLRVN